MASDAEHPLASVTVNAYKEEEVMPLIYGLAEEVALNPVAGAHR
jgi:hypothetical protein